LARKPTNPPGKSDAPRLTDRQRLAWLRLIRSENVGPATFRALVNQLGGAEAAIAALPALSRRGGGHAVRLCSEAEAEAEIALGRVGATLVGIGEPGYPHALAEIECLSLKGDASPFARRPIASDKA